MLCFDIRSLEQHAVSVDDTLAADDPVWEETDLRPAEPVRVTGRLSPAGMGRFYFSGELEGTIGGECRRCLTPVTAQVADDVHAIFAEADDEETDDDPDVYRFDPHDRELDLRPAIREAFQLSAPGFALCREDCKGLCPTCGTDLNAGECDCPPVIDGRWDALREMRDAKH